MTNETKDIIERLLSLVNNTRALQQSVTDYGLTYNFYYSHGIFQLIVGCRKDIEGSGRLNFLALGDQIDETKPSWKIPFEEEYEVIKYILYVIFGIELKEVFTEDISNVNLYYYEEDKLNKEFSEILLDIKKDKTLLKQFEIRNKIDTQNENERIENFENFYDQFYTDDIMPLTIENEVYTGELNNTNNVGRIWDNIVSFKILNYGFKFHSKKERKYPCYSLWVKFQIRSFIEEEYLHNFYDITIPDFIVFPASNETVEARLELKNNLNLLYNLNYDALYLMLQNEYENFTSSKFRIGISSLETGIEIKDFAEDVLSRLSSYLLGRFYIGSKGVYTVEDVKKFEKIFLEQSISKGFMKNLFAEFLICCTGLKINDLNTVDSFYTMVENISKKYEEYKPENE